MGGCRVHHSVVCCIVVGSAGRSHAATPGRRRTWNQVPVVRQKWDPKVEDVPPEGESMQAGLHATSSQLPGVCNLNGTVCERLDQHSGHFAASHLWLQALLSTWISRFVDVVACLVNEEAAAYQARLTGVLSSALKSLGLDSWSNVELLLVGKLGVEFLQLTLRFRNAFFHASGNWYRLMGK